LLITTTTTIYIRVSVEYQLAINNSKKRNTPLFLTLLFLSSPLQDRVRL
jgi:hypothetical protein